MIIQTRNPVGSEGVRYTATFTVDQLDKAKQLAEKRGYSVSHVVRELVGLGLLCVGQTRATGETRVGMLFQREIKISYPMFDDPAHDDDDLLQSVESAYDIEVAP